MARKREQKSGKIPIDKVVINKSELQLVHIPIIISALLFDVMASRKRHYLFISCILSTLAIILPIASIFTVEWVNSQVKVRYDLAAKEKNWLHFGLFGGNFVQKYATTASFELKMICSFDYNVCALLCGDNIKENLEKMAKGENVTSGDRGCGSYAPENASFEKPVFIQATVWLSTLVCLGISSIFGCLAVLLTLLNLCIKMPNFCASYTLCILNLFGFLACFAGVLIWGLTFYNEISSSDVPTYKTIYEGFTTKSLSKLGYSYWLNCGTLLLYFLSICVLSLRKYLKFKQAKAVIYLEQSNIDDNKLYLY